MVPKLRVQHNLTLEFTKARETEDPRVEKIFEEQNRKAESQKEKTTKNISEEQEGGPHMGCLEELSRNPFSCRISAGCGKQQAPGLLLSQPDFIAHCALLRVLKINHRRIGIQPPRRDCNWKKLWIPSPRMNQNPVKDKNRDEKLPSEIKICC
ncbi:hypothetical protein llap_8595 [Limosa lapponica baueri]|uniref:Uncharacterized protein n=1 Tax=Limosa lapponica baueri TaxID=1758121 RepID=A0A2I0U502_LIMLA|nr:hypothetical protein llap_8595 [Limosa lapponica baueri]